MNSELSTFYLLLVALAIGLLIGVERGWQERDSEEGQRVAGVRTYGLIGLLGGVLGVLSVDFGALIIGLGLIGLFVLCPFSGQTIASGQLEHYQPGSSTFGVFTRCFGRNGSGDHRVISGGGDSIVAQQ